MFSWPQNLVLILALGLGQAAGTAELCPTVQLSAELCPTVQLKESIKPAFDKNELSLICGADHEDVNVSEGWKTIPHDQAIFNLKNFLQSRGYLNPVIQANGSVLSVSPGELPSDQCS